MGAMNLAGVLKLVQGPRTTETGLAQAIGDVTLGGGELVLAAGDTGWTPIPLGLPPDVDEAVLLIIQTSKAVELELEDGDGDTTVFGARGLQILTLEPGKGLRGAQVRPLSTGLDAVRVFYTVGCLQADQELPPFWQG